MQHIARRLPLPNSPSAEADLATLAGMLVEQKGRYTLDVAMDQFFQNAPEPGETQQLLARLPFRIVINAARDKYICRAFDYDPRDPRAFGYHLFGTVDCFDPAKGQPVKTLGLMVLTSSG